MTFGRAQLIFLPNCQANLTFLFVTSDSNSTEIWRVSKCEHCDVDAYYKLNVEYFYSENMMMYLCVKCVRAESEKLIDDLPAIRSLKVE
jgi:hypothetical protein